MTKKTSGLITRRRLLTTVGALFFLAAFSLAATLLSPFATAAAVRLNLAG